MEDKKVEVVVEKKRKGIILGFVGKGFKKVGEFTVKAGDAIINFPDNHPKAYKRIKIAVAGTAGVVGYKVVKDVIKKNDEVDALEWHELPDPDPEDEELDHLETEAETSEDMEEPAEE